ncbi:Organic solute transporter alpha-like protein [Eufriesea mexicana]|uniref:Organic solute transporter alpha-like protein n=1 Tax=Eufriesea mexicana TaxID=516756 RepID=A0A310SI18_9HYME|nr:PREDICTED: organic solute transporter alpha-like protein isoform X1 [Eufriesea mexicana]OAD53102.1 Organic solute transporter alpha-like protein [Eufriesea mexicana]
MEIEFKNLEKSVKNLSCNYDYVPSAIENIESLGTFGIGLLSFGAILSTLTLYFALDACHNIFYQKETKLYKTNSITILSVYPVASICSLTALGIPRTQLLSEAVTQIFLTISLYRLHLLLVYVGRKKVTTTPPLVLRVGPCCCWPCLPFPRLEMTDANLSWVRLLVLQLPIIQGLTYCIFLFMSIEEPSLITQYGICLQPFMVISILLGIYGLTITLKSLQEVAPEEKLHRKATVSQLMLLFSKLQAFIVKSLSHTGLFPCNPPITPQIYANVTYNALMLIEMLLLCYAARYVYYVELEREEETAAVEATDRSKDKSTEQATSTNNNEANRQPSALTA